MASSIGVGVFFRISFILFIISAMLTGGLYLAQSYISSNLKEEKSLLSKINEEFEPTLIAELERVGASIRAAKSILQQHTHASKVFETLESNTLTEVAFSSFAFTTDKRTVTMAGNAPSYAGVAAQAAVFGALPEVVSVAFSNTALNENGTVGFSITMNLK